MKTCLKLIPCALLAFAINAQAAVTITIQEVGNDVVVNGTGFVSIDPAMKVGTEQDSAFDILDPSAYRIQAGSNTTELNYFYFQPHWESIEMAGQQPSFGTGSEIRQPTNNTGDAFGISFENDGAVLRIALPAEYEQGDRTNFSMTFANTTLSRLGIDPGSSQWSWGVDDEGEFVYLNVIAPAVPPTPTAATPVPTLGVFGLLGLAGAIGAAGIAATRRRN